MPRMPRIPARCAVTGRYAYIFVESMARRIVHVAGWQTLVERLPQDTAYLIDLDPGAVYREAGRLQWTLSAAGDDPGKLRLVFDATADAGAQAAVFTVPVPATEIERRRNFASFRLERNTANPYLTDPDRGSL